MIAHPRLAATPFILAALVRAGPAAAFDGTMSPLVLPAAMPVVVSDAAPVPLPDPVRAMIEAAMAGGVNRDVETVVALAKATNPRSVTQVDAMMTAWQAKRAGHDEPDPVREILAAAMKSKKDGDVEAVGKLAKATLPEQAADIDKLLADYRAERAAEKKAAADAERARLAAARFWQNWKGEGQIGATLSTGNSRSKGLNAGLALARKGIDWNYKLRAQADYQRTNGSTSVERYLAEVEPQYRVSDRAFAYGLARWERDPIVGFDARWNISAGLGYKLVDRKALSLSVKGGPAWRRVDYRTSPDESELTALAGVDFGWQVSPTLRLTQVASTVIGGDNMLTSSLTALNAKLTGALSARLSYSADINTDPPPGIEKVDTLTRFSLVYGF